MEEFTLVSFRYGLDTRREVLSSQPGALITCENAHITSGGEIEKRKAFVRLGAIVQSGGDSFGLEVTDSGLTVFGTIASGSIILNPGISNLAYQPVTHPAVTENGGGYTIGKHDIDVVKSSCSFDGKSLIAVTFKDGKTYLFHDGTLVAQSRNGLVIEGRTSIANLSTELTAEVNALPFWQAAANQDQFGTASDGTTIIKSPPNIFFTPVNTDTSSGGDLGIILLDSSAIAVTETKAIAGFTVAGGAGTFELTAPANNDGTGTAALTGGAIATGSSTSVTASTIVQAINDLTSVHGYTALVGAAGSTDSVFVYAPITWGAAANWDVTLRPNMSLTVVTTGAATAGAAGTAPTALSAVTVPSPMIVNRKIIPNDSFSVTVSGTAFLAVSGGNGVYSYAWSEANVGGNSGHGIKITNINTTSPTFSKDLFVPATYNGITSVTGAFKCVIADTAIAAPLTVYLNVTLNLGYTFP